MKLFSSFFTHHLKHAGHLQALGAACIVFSAAILLQFPIELALVLLPYGLFLPIYLNDRYYDFKTSPEDDRERSEHIRHYDKSIPLVVVIVAAVTLGILMWLSNYVLIVFSVLVYILGLLYPSFFKSLTLQVPLFKNIYVAAVFAALVFIPSMYFAAVRFDEITLLFAGFVSLEALIMQMHLDLKDRTSDGKRGLKTLPNIIGYRSAVSLIAVLIVVSVLFALLTPLPMFVQTLAVTSALINGIALWLVDRGDDRGYVLMAAKFIFWIPLAAL